MHLKILKLYGCMFMMELVTVWVIKIKNYFPFSSLKEKMLLFKKLFKKNARLHVGMCPEL